MKAKHFVITILFFIGALTTVQAQRGERPDPKVQAKTNADTWQKEFGLSDDQRTKVYDLLIKSAEDRTKKMTELRSSGDREGMREAFTKLQAETDKGLKAIFTDAQWIKYENWKKENPPRRRSRGGN
ncbi:hypothetical protein KCTC32516_00763 [Polaribacter huanghezhanensis]|uniref:hypothetical protein n=1 Tax=Polaribacter huanghezhanensis TaxID=1354726 RepID=UPI002647F070|nr:hypothetical protein [Polaribacter huanghezhanensis]WKD85423.1 hypothetical protein KCTC32516_00763 [Polaribacter huanghezhanensis]